MYQENFSKNYDKTRELCFDKNEFLKESFSVENFLREHRNKASLEIMRDDLGTHLKTLRLSMLELINKDYEDFVNLSKDLVGLDDDIKKLQIPLEQIRKEILEVKSNFEEAISGFNICLGQHKEVTDRKKSLIYVTQVITCIKKLNSILEPIISDDKDISVNLIERAAMEFNQLQFSVSKCDNDLLVSQKKEADDIKDRLMTLLNNKFLECMKKNNSDEILKCLRIYSALDKIYDLESLVRQNIVCPKFSKIINEQKLQKEPDGMDYVFDEIIKFIESELVTLLQLTTCGHSLPPVRGYNIMINSVWPELEKRLNLPFMFAPGDPKLFHSRFTKCIKLLKKFEVFCGNRGSVLQLRQNEQYQLFLQKWNLPVYFKIRFQEIAGHLEKLLGEINNETQCLISGSGEPYDLKSSCAVVQQVKKCWQNDIYLAELSHMFWKLSLQILSRYTVWVWDLLRREMKFINQRKVELSRLQTASFGMENYQIKTRLDFLVCLFSDTNKLLNEIKSYLESCKEKIPNRELVEEELSVSLEESLGLVEGTVPKITETIIKVIVNESAIHFHQVSQIPRLFRRTNRKSSTEPCEYIGQVFSFPKKFREWKKNLITEKILESWFTSIFDELTNQFFVAVNEVLTNAQKTEESLRKLKKKKENFQSSNSGNEEIRQQLVIDVHSFFDGVKEFNVQIKEVKKLKELIDLVETAREKSEKQ